MAVKHLAMHQVEAARAAALAAHSAAGLADAAALREAARLLRSAEALARAAVAVLVSASKGHPPGGAPVLPPRASASRSSLHVRGEPGRLSPGGNSAAGEDTATAEGNVLGGAGNGTHGTPVGSSKRRRLQRRRKTQMQQLDKTDGTDVAPVRPSGSEDRDTRGSAVTAPIVQPIAEPRVLAPRVSRER